MPLRTLVAAVVLLLLVRAARVAWRQRALLRAVWSAVSWRHVLGSIGLLAGVVLTASVLLAVPGMDLGLGRLLGTTGNVVFSPLEEGLALSGPAPRQGTDWVLLLGASAFLGLLTLLLPWLAFVEEELFRAGLEVASWPRVVAASLGFGLLHLVMLVPLAAAVAIGVAGFGYAIVYRRAHAQVRATPTVARVAFRPPRRARAVAATAAVAAVTDAEATRDGRQAETRAEVPGGVPDEVPREVPDEVPGSLGDHRQRWRDAQAAGVFHAAVWHTTVNTLVVVTVWISVVAAALR